MGEICIISDALHNRPREESAAANDDDHCTRECGKKGDESQNRAPVSQPASTTTGILCEKLPLNWNFHLFRCFEILQLFHISLPFFFKVLDIH